MACRVIQDPKLFGGAPTFVCGPRPRRTKCKFCAGVCAKLCDFPIFRNGKKRTCDAPCCQEHHQHRGPDFDVCPDHYNAKLKL